MHLFTVENAPEIDKTKLGFFITASKADTALEADIAKGGCLLDDLDHTLVLFTFADMAEHLNEEGDEYKFSYTIAPGKQGEYSLYYTNCVPNTAVSFNLEVELFNPMKGGGKDYLSAGEKPLPTLYLLAFFVYAAVGVVWAITLFNSKHSQPGSVQQIHLLMGVLVFFKCLTVLCQSGMYHLIRMKGDPEGWNIAFYIFYSIRGLLLFTVVVLIGTGWSFLKPFLNDREKQVLMIVIPLQVFANIAVVILDENGPALNGWLEWRDLFHLLTLFNSKHSQPGSVQQIHLLMGVLVFFKCLTVLCQSGMYHLIRMKGDPEGWNIAFYIFYSIRGLLLFTVVVLIGTGWSFLKPFLNDREKQVLMIVIPLQVFANIAVVILDENGPALNGWLEWRDLFHLLDIICCCAILFPIVWSIKHLREAAMTDGKKIRNMNKLILFRQFYVMVVAYIYFTRIIVFLLKSTAAYDLTWLSNLAEECATLAFYLCTGWMFRPIVENPYLHLNEDELELEDIEAIVEEGVEGKGA